jgi:predicted glycoside hydrolase/deacetylase ChbG (UPF0249 family)
MSSDVRLIVNADDFGHSPGVDAGVIEAHERGIVTSASLMVTRPNASEAAAYARSSPRLAVGLHIDLGEWRYAAGRWHSDDAVPAERLAAEIAAQLAAFRELIGADPTHLDSHQHVHLREPARELLTALAARLGVPLRGLDPAVRYEGRFFGQSKTGEPLAHLIAVGALLELVAALPAGTTELGCHPGKGDIPGSSYSREREHEVRALCDPSVRAAIEGAGIALISFADIRG